MPSSPDRKFFRGAARAVGGAIIFALPLLMTLEMWELGSRITPARMAALLLATLPMLVFLSAYSGFESTVRIFHDILDAFVAIALAAVAAAITLSAVAVLTTDSSFTDWVGKIALQVVPGSIGALLAQSQFGARRGDDEEPSRGKTPRGGNVRHAAELGIMAVGALFLGLNVAPTEEIQIIASRASDVHMAMLVLFSVVLIHAFVFALEFRGHHAGAASAWSALVRFSLPGYAIALALSAFLLWIFGRFDGQSVDQALQLSVTLAFPSAVGAAAARLIL
jgi:putative integral membrane protein (TIGR02587 family)